MYCKTEWRTDSLDLTGHFSIEQATNYVRCIASILFLRKSCFLNRFVKEWFMKGPKILLAFADIPPRSWCYVLRYFAKRQWFFLRKDDWLLKYGFCKGQLISKCPFGFIVWTKIPTNLFLDFCLEFFCSFLGASWKLFGLPGDLVCNIINKEACRKPAGSPKKLQGSPQEGTKSFRAEIQK